MGSLLRVCRRVGAAWHAFACKLWSVELVQQAHRQHSTKIVRLRLKVKCRCACALCSVRCLEDRMSSTIGVCVYAYSVFCIDSHNALCILCAFGTMYWLRFIYVRGKISLCCVYTLCARWEYNSAHVGTSVYIYITCTHTGFWKAFNAWWRSCRHTWLVCVWPWL